jgi:glycerophosphoryl diester phosphodiesterase
MLLLMLACLSISAVATSAVARAPTKASTMALRTALVTVSAHRGGAGQWPQNSLRAFSKALAAGYDEIEGDTWITADGRHVIYHDNTISPTVCTGGYANRNIWTLTFAQVARIRCSGQPIPTEAQLLSLVAHSSNEHTVLRLETKSYPGQSAASAKGWAYRVGRQVVRARLTSRAVMQDFDWDGIAGYHAASATLRVSALTKPIRHQLIAKAAALGADDISYKAVYSTPAINADIVAHHLVATVWGADAVPAALGTPSAAVVAAAKKSFTASVCSGVRVVITNYPALLSGYRSRLTCPVTTRRLAERPGVAAVAGRLDLGDVDEQVGWTCIAAQE